MLSIDKKQKAFACAKEPAGERSVKMRIYLSSRAFTLVELLVVIVIVGLLSTIVLVSLSPINKQGRDAKRMQDFRQISTAMEAYDIMGDGYLETTAGSNTLDSIPGYVNNVPRDPVDSGLHQYSWTEGNADYYCLYTKLEEVENGWFCSSNYGLRAKVASSYLPTNEDCCGVNVATGSSLFSCGDNVSFYYNGEFVTYGTVESLGECWLDRNLGASRVATSYNDSQAYGDLFQWGREADGHQVRSPAPGVIEGDMTLTAQPGHGNFITEQSSPYDWASSAWTARWTIASSDPCPAGFRMPTSAELDAERASWAQQNYNGAFASPLKLTAAGYRVRNTASLSHVGSIGCYWSSSVSGSNASTLSISATEAYVTGYYRAYGFSARCLKD
jgi:prepilin-type N-terminal cleavage/methylation domain-containing protein